MFCYNLNDILDFVRDGDNLLRWDYKNCDIDVHNKDNEIVYEIEVPGFTKKDLDLSFENSILFIKGKRKVGDKEKEISKQFKVNCNSKNIKAKVENGILYVTFVKDNNTKILIE